MDQKTSTLEELGDKLNPRQRGLVKGVIGGKTQKQSAIDEGYSPLAAKVTASRIMHRPDVRRYYRALLDHAGIGDEYLANKLRELMEAEQFGLTKDGNVVGMGADGNVRVKAVDLALKLMNAYPDARLDVDVKAVQVVVFRAEEMLGEDCFAPIEDTSV